MYRLLNSTDLQFCADNFEKVKTFRKPIEWKLPEKHLIFTGIPKKVEKLHEIGVALNETKSKLNEYNLSEWSRHTNKRNLINAIKYHLRTEIKAQIITQAWLKMWELLHKFDLIRDDLTEANTVHLSEVPGAFVCAINHYVKTKRRNAKWNWLASSKNPYYEGNDTNKMINDDRLVVHSLDNWCFGKSWTGDIFEKETRQDIIENACNLGEILLITADGSIDCSSTPSVQEETVADLVWIEVLTALRIISKGGNFVFKIFTICEWPTICLVYLVNCCFQTVDICKPVTSRDNNSELYVVCKDFSYNRNDSEWIEYLDLIENNLNLEKLNEQSIFPEDSIPMTFLQQVYAFISYFADWQMKAIDRNITAFPSMVHTQEHKKRQQIIQEICRCFIEKYSIEVMSAGDQIINDFSEEYIFDPIDRTPFSKSFTEFISSQSFNDGQMKYDLKIQSNKSKEIEVWPYCNDFISLDVPQYKTCDEIIQNGLHFQFGKEVNDILNSKFVTMALFKLLLKFGTLEWDDISTVDCCDQENKSYIITFGDKNLLYNLKKYEQDFFRLFFLSLESGYETMEFETLILNNVVLFSLKMVGFLYLICELIVDDKKVEVSLSNSGTIIITGINRDIRNAILLIKDAIPLDNNLLGIVDIKLIRANMDFYTNIVHFNNFSVINFCNKIANKTTLSFN